MLITTQKDLRNRFWHAHPELRRVAGRTQNDYPTDVRLIWCDFVEYMHRCGLITDKMAGRATL